MPDGARKRFPVEIKPISIPSRKAENAAGDSIMLLLRDALRLKRFSIHGLARIAEATDAARCTRNWIVLGNVVAWILIILAVRVIFF
jgi:hypothetical protein